MDFDLPRDFIAQHPVQPHDSSRLLAAGTALSDHVFRELPALLRSGDLLVFNDTRVPPTRRIERRGKAAVGMMLAKPFGAGQTAEAGPRNLITKNGAKATCRS